jgi:hypothetical protein
LSPVLLIYARFHKAASTVLNNLHDYVAYNESHDQSHAESAQGSCRITGVVITATRIIIQQCWNEHFSFHCTDYERDFLSIHPRRRACRVFRTTWQSLMKFSLSGEHWKPGEIYLAALFRGTQVCLYRFPTHNKSCHVKGE